ncbi:hypothetical protein EVAR_84908_1 [Eumeta japonica]|uniref:Uncharacterized protein n=1 Tax=Eumeta variegata TaxID=151549 RepID=A0A4C1Z802_EUMVA|nr:hypothetical protein EVAR_84908_1 [Eumeta japonica]
MIKKRLVSIGAKKWKIKYNHGTSKAVYNIYTGDEFWIDPETKQELTVWVFRDEPNPTKLSPSTPPEPARYGHSKFFLSKIRHRIASCDKIPAVITHEGVLRRGKSSEAGKLKTLATYLGVKLRFMRPHMNPKGGGSAVAVLTRTGIMHYLCRQGTERASSAALSNERSKGMDCTMQMSIST